MVLATVCTIFGVYILVVIWARKADMLDERKVDVIIVAPEMPCIGQFYLNQKLPSLFLEMRSYKFTFF